MTSHPAASAPMPLDTALGLVVQGRVAEVVQTLGEGVVRLGDDQLGQVTSALLRIHALTEGAVFALAAEADARGVIAASTAAGTAQWVRARASEAESAMTPAVAQGFAKVVDATRLPGMAVLKDATTQGRIPVAGARVVAEEFGKLRGKIHPDCQDPALEGLVDYCAGGASGRRLAEARDAILSQYGIATAFADECDERAARARLSGFRRTRDGMYAAQLELDPASHAVVEAALSALSAPTRSVEGFADIRSPGKRRADALVELCSVVATDPDLLSRSHSSPENAQPGRAARARVVVTIPYPWLHAQTGFGRTGFDQPLAPADVRRIACDAQIIPVVLGSRSEPLDVGRASRLATPAQRVALALRDRGCTFPGCDRPPSWCDAHHLREWEQRDGPTDLDNLALLCGRHHTIAHRDHLDGTVENMRDGPRVTWRPPGLHAAAA